MKPPRIIAPRADWLAVLDAMTAPERDEVTWADGVIDAAQPAFPRGRVGVYQLHYAPDLAEVAIAHTRPAAMDDAMLLLANLARRFGAAAWAPFHLGAPVVTQAEAKRLVDRSVEASMMDIRGRWSVEDGVAVIAHPAPGRVVVLHAVFEHLVQLAPHERLALARVGLHLDAAARLRHAPARVIAELSPTGRLLHREPDAPATTSLERHIARVRGAAATDRFALWSALVAGRASIVRRRQGSQTRYVVLENPPPSHERHALTPMELKVLELAARGHSMKLIAYGLGVSAPNVSRSLASAGARMGALSRMELVRLAALLLRDRPASLEDGLLSKAEQDVYELLRDGLSNRAIAAARSRSLRTVANQVASILRKTNAPSRRALLAR